MNAEDEILLRRAELGIARQRMAQILAEPPIELTSRPEANPLIIGGSDPLPLMSEYEAWERSERIQRARANLQAWRESQRACLYE